MNVSYGRDNPTLVGPGFHLVCPPIPPAQTLTDSGSC
jgi:hypothetical protein